MSLKQISIIGLLLASMLSLTACAPEVGSEALCNAMKEKPKGDW